MIEACGKTETSSDGKKAPKSHGASGEASPSNRNRLKLEALELDHGLILRVQRLTTGATVHRFSQALTIYIGNLEMWNRFVAQEQVTQSELEEKEVLRNRALAMQVQLRQDVLKEELRSITSRTNRFS